MSRGTLAKSSRQIDEVIGIAMIVSTTIATSTPDCCGVPAKSGIQPNLWCRNGSMWTRMNGPRTKIPHRPMTTLGTAARPLDQGARSGRGTTGGASSP